MTYRFLTVAVLAIGATGVYATAQTSNSAPGTPNSTSARQQQVQQRLEQRLDTRFTRLDTNQDGVVSRDEWKGRAGVFDRLDANHDGAVSKDELQQALQQREAQVRQRVQKGVDARFDQLDANHDGVLSKDEARPALSRLVLRRLAARRLLIGR